MGTISFVYIYKAFIFLSTKSVAWDPGGSYDLIEISSIFCRCMEQLTNNVPCPLQMLIIPFVDQETIAADDVLQDPSPQIPSTNSKEALEVER